MLESREPSLIQSNPLAETDNNLCERNARILKGKMDQTISLRSFELYQKANPLHILYFLWKMGSCRGIAKQEKQGKE